jgi:hypothetical protein
VQLQKIVPPHPLSIVPHCPAPHVVGVQHSFVPTLQTWAPLQKLQFSVPPQPSENVPPHVVPAYAWHVFGVHGAPQWPLPLQTLPLPQPPQSTVLPHAVVMVPQLTSAWAHSFGTRVGAQTLFVPPAPQASPAGQFPQFSRPPQPSEAVPQLKPCWAHVCLLQAPQTCVI